MKSFERLFLAFAAAGLIFNLIHIVYSIQKEPQETVTYVDQLQEQESTRSRYPFFLAYPAATMTALGIVSLSHTGIKKRNEPRILLSAIGCATALIPSLMGFIAPTLFSYGVALGLSTLLHLSAVLCITIALGIAHKQARSEKDSEVCIENIGS